MQQTVRTTCPYCGVGCGVLVSQNEPGKWQVKGDPHHPANLGRLCSKGAALGETLEQPDRLLHPQIDGRKVSWDDAVDHVAQEFRRVIDEHGPEAVAFYVSGQLLTEDYYVANKLMKGFIGSANIDTNSRLCMSSSVAGHKRAFGADVVPCSYTDLELADVVVLTGSNTAWCHPVLFQRLRKAKQERPDMRIVVIDPRRTATCDIADLHLALQPGTDIRLFNGLLGWLDRNDDINWEFVINHTQDIAHALGEARRAGEPCDVAAACGLSTDEVENFYTLWSGHERVVTVYSQGVNQWSCGTDKVNAIINCHLATGRIGQPGAGPFSFTGQPNAMGGREVGGLANQLAAHMDFDEESIERVSNFWQAESMAVTPGLKAIEMFDAIEDGRIKAVWIMATNPAVSLPDAGRVRRALEHCELVVVSDCVANTDTTALADVLLPAASWGEKSGTVTNSERCISRQRNFMPVPGEARADWWIISAVARRMGFTQAFAYESPAEIFREHATLSALENNGKRAFNIGGMAALTNNSYNDMSPCQWPVPAGGNDQNNRLLANPAFWHTDRRARFIATSDAATKLQSKSYPLALNTGRIRDQWHTMTRTGHVARLTAHISEPYVQMHPDDAARRGITDGSIVRLVNEQGEAMARADISDKQLPGGVFVPMHWSGPFSKNARINELVPARYDPHSGQPQFKHSAIEITPVSLAWQAFILSRRRLTLKIPVYAVTVTGNGYYRYILGGDDNIQDPAQWIRTITGASADWIEYRDATAGHYRAAQIVNDCLELCVFMTSSDSLPSHEWLATLFHARQIEVSDRSSLLSGRPANQRDDSGRTICACFSVGINTLIDAITSNHLTTVDEIGKLLKAGTNCGSCIPELDSLLRQSVSTG